MASIFESMLPANLPQQMAAVVALVVDMRNALHNIDDKLGASLSVPKSHDPVAVHFNIPAGASGFVTSQRLRLTNLILSNDIAGTITLAFGNESVAPFNVPANSTLQLRWQLNEARDIDRGTQITVVGSGGMVVKATATAFPS